MLWLLLSCTPDVDVVHRGARPRQRALEATWDLVREDVEGWREESEVPGLAIAVVVDGRLRFSEGFGVSGDDEVDVGTVFRWGSVSKPMVATAVLGLVDDGVLSLDDPMSMWLPDFTPSGPFSLGQPTVGQLLNHTSALADRLVWNCDVSDEGLQNDLNNGFQVPLLGPPGVYYNYSNSGYSALGAVLEVALGRPFRELMVDEVFEPAGMRTATYDVHEAVEWGGGPGLGGSDGVTVMPIDDWDCAVARPPAWLHGTVVDVARFLERVDEGPLAPRMSDTVNTHWQGDGQSRAGPGLFRVEFRDQLEMWHHDGWVAGFVSAISWFPSEGLGVVVVANRDRVNVAGVRNRIVDRFLGFGSDDPRHQAQFDDVLRTELVGSYVQPVYNFAPGWAIGKLKIVESEDRLWLVTTDPEMEWTPLIQSDGDAFGFYIGGTAHFVRFIEEDGAMFMVNRSWVARRP